MSNAELIKRLREHGRGLGSGNIFEDVFACAAALETADAEIASLRERNADLEEVIDKMQEGFRFLYLHESKREKKI